MKTLGLIGCTALLGACTGNGVSLTPSDDWQQSTHSETELSDSEQGQLLKIAYSDFDQGVYRKLLLTNEKEIVRAIDDKYGYFENEGPLHISASGIAVIHQIDSGLATTGNDTVRHDRYYCMFISLRNACVIARRTGAVCDGSWSGPNTWSGYGQTLDMNEAVVTVAEVAAGHITLTDMPESSRENLEFCDPPKPQATQTFD